MRGSLVSLVDFLLWSGHSFASGGARDQILHILAMNLVIVVHVHRSKLQERELAAVLTHSLLPKENRTFRRQLDRGGDHRNTGDARTRADRLPAMSRRRFTACEAAWPAPNPDTGSRRRLVLSLSQSSGKT